MKNLAVVFMGAFVLAGCGSVRYPTSYVLNFPPPAPQPARPETRWARSRSVNFDVLNTSVKDASCIVQVRKRSLSTNTIVGRWIPVRLSRNMSSTVFRPNRYSRAWRSTIMPRTTAYALSGNIERLEEVDQGREVRVVCTISAQLLDTRTRSVVWSHTASETVQRRET